MVDVTIPGGADGTPVIKFTYSTDDALIIAQQISSALASAVASHSLEVTTVSGGSIPALPTISGAVQELLLLASTGSPTVPAGYGFIIANGALAETIVGGPGSVILSNTQGGAFFGTGAMTVAAAGGSNAISQSGAGAVALASGAGNDTIWAAGTGGTISGGLGHNLFILSGTGEFIHSTGTDTISMTGATGSDTISAGGNGTISGGTSTISAGNGTISGGNGTVGAGNDTIQVSGSATIRATGSTLVFGDGNVNFIGGTGTSTIIGGTGVESIQAGTGGVVFLDNTANNATIDSGTGNVTIFGAPGATVNLVGGASQNVLVAGGGNETLNAAGSSGSNFMSINASAAGAAARMIGGSGADTLVAGAANGATTMTGGAGADAFVFFKQPAGGALDVVTDFTSSDSVFIQGYGGGGSAAGLQGGATVSASGLTLNLNDGTTITFTNLNNASALNGKIQYS